ncbi:MAG: flagellar basal body P-ring formation protein FlgA [Oligoflexia bacterium]|nr:flagellar basal body P-ring formation protein FlgA [Oligoflexia bacterium]
MKRSILLLLPFFLLLYSIAYATEAYASIVPPTNHKDTLKFCTVLLPATIFFPDKVTDVDNQLIRESNCSKDIKQEIIKTIVSIKGKINEDSLNFLIKNKLVHVGLQPSTIQIYNLNDYLKDLFSLDENKIFNNSKILSTKNYIALDEDEYLEILSSKDEILREENKSNITIKMAIVNIKNRDSIKIWITTSIQTKIKVLRSNKNIMGFTNNSLDSFFVEDIIYTSKPEGYFQNKEALKYYQLNRPLAEGTILKSSDIVPYALIKNGQSVNVSYQDGNLRLSIEALARSNGYFGEVIELNNPKSNKKLWGKVIGLNQVLIER